MAKVSIEDRVYKSKNGFFTVWRMAQGYGIYNNDGVKIAFTFGRHARSQRMAELTADAIETEYQR